MRRPHVKGDGRGWEVVEQMWSRFQYPDIDTVASPSTIGGGGGAPTIVVAASDASEFSKSKADYICTGVDDGATIQAANDSLPTTIGRIVLTEGSYQIADPPTLSNGVSMVGMGSAATVLVASTSSPDGAGVAVPVVYMADGGHLAYLSIEAVGRTDRSGVRLQNASATGTGKIESCYISAEDHYGVQVVTGIARVVDCEIITQTSGIGVEVQAAEDAVIRGCTINSVDDGVTTDQDNTRIAENYISSSAGDGIVIGSSVDYTAIVGNNIDVNGYGIRFSGADDHVRIVGNYISALLDGIRINGFNNDEAIIVGNSIRGADRAIFASGTGFARSTIADNYIATSTPDTSAHGIYLTGSLVLNVTIEGNVFHNVGGSGIYLDGTGRMTVDANLIQLVNLHGIHLDDVSLGVIANNHIYSPGQQTDNTYDGVFVEGNSDENFIHGNMIVGKTSTPQPRYAVNISAATCECNIVVGNRFGDTAEYGTDQLNDAGVDTQLFWPNDATYGDNFIGCYGS